MLSNMLMYEVLTDLMKGVGISERGLKSVQGGRKCLRLSDSHMTVCAGSRSVHSEYWLETQAQEIQTDDSMTMAR